MAERPQPNRWRCCVTGCNPKLIGVEAAEQHRDEFGHRIAKWPQRSEEGKRRARRRNQSGYYDKYNVGAKSPSVRFRAAGRPAYGGDHPFSAEALGQD